MNNVAYGLLGAPLAMAALPLFVQLPAYYATHLDVALAPLGATLFAARMIDMLQDPVLGHLLDRAQATRRRWMVAGAVVLALAFAALWLPPAGISPLPWLAVMLVLGYGAHSLVNIAYLAWGAQLQAPLPAVAWREGAGLVGMLFASLIPAAILATGPQQMRNSLALYSIGYALLLALGIWALLRHAPLPTQQVTMATTAASAHGAEIASDADGAAAADRNPGADSGRGTIGAAAADRKTRTDNGPGKNGAAAADRKSGADNGLGTNSAAAVDRNLGVESGPGTIGAAAADRETGADSGPGTSGLASAVSADGGGWRDVLREIFRHRALRSLLLPYFLNALSVAIPATLALFFIGDQLRAPQLAGMFLACYFGAAAVGLPAWTALARKYGPLACWRLGMLLSVVGFCGAAALGPGDTMPYLAVCLLAGAALGADLALPPVLLGLAIGERLGAGAGFGLFTLLGKLALAIAGLSLPLLSWLGYRPSQGGSGGGDGLAGVAGAAGGALVIAYAILPCALKLLALLALKRCTVTAPHVLPPVSRSTS